MDSGNGDVHISNAPKEFVNSVMPRLRTKCFGASVNYTDAYASDNYIYVTVCTGSARAGRLFTHLEHATFTDTTCPLNTSFAFLQTLCSVKIRKFDLIPIALT